MNKHDIQIDSDACIGCNLCVQDCPVNNIQLEKAKAKILHQACIKCGHCVAICPKNAIYMDHYSDEPISINQQLKIDPKTLLHAIQTRRSIRHFQETPIDEAILKDLLEAGRYSPTAKNAQDLTYIVLKDAIAKYEQLAIQFFKRLLPVAKWFMPSARHVAIDDHFFFKKAPLVILVLSKDSISASLASANMALVAESYGLGVLYSGFFVIAANYSRALKKALGIHKQKVVTTLVIGHPNVKYQRSAQRENAQVTYL